MSAAPARRIVQPAGAVNVTPADVARGESAARRSAGGGAGASGDDGGGAGAGAGIDVAIGAPATHAASPRHATGSAFIGRCETQLRCQRVAVNRMSFLLGCRDTVYGRRFRTTTSLSPRPQLIPELPNCQ